MELQRCWTAEQIAEVEAFLREADLTVTGLGAPTIRLWVERAGVGGGASGGGEFGGVDSGGGESGGVDSGGDESGGVDSGGGESGGVGSGGGEFGGAHSRGGGLGRIVGSTGWEVSTDGRHALIRSVAVAPERRLLGRGRALATFALERAAAEGAHTAWLFSRRSGAFWQSLGFAPADRDELASVLGQTHQVETFRRTGQLTQEVAWRRSLLGE